MIISLNADIFALQEISNSQDFNDLIVEINRLDDDNEWIGYRGPNSQNYLELGYLIKLDQIEIINQPYTILDQYYYYFVLLQ